MKQLLPIIVLFNFLIFPFKHVDASCTLVPVTLAQRVKDCDLVAKVTVLDKKSAWDDEHKNIYTIYTVLASQSYTAEHLTYQLFDFAVIGGQVDEEILKVSPGFDLAVPSEGMLFLKYSPINIGGKQVKFIPYAYAQGYIPYDLLNDRPQDIFFTHHSIRSFEEEVANLAKGNKISRKDLHLPEALPLTYAYYQDSVKRLRSAPLKKSDSGQGFATFISSIIPGVINAGVGNEVTINGSGFGTQGNGSSIALPNADNGGRSYATVSNDDILWWSNSQIRFRVRDGFGTGRVIVTTSNGQSITSVPNLTINYSIINYTTFGSNGRTVQSADWYNRNGAGGYTFTFNQSFNNNLFAVEAFKRALESWRCNTLCNLNINTNPTGATCHADDGINLISFDNNCGSWEGVLAVTFNRVSGCTQNGQTFLQVREFDILFGSRWNWNYGPGASLIGQTDFETVALHEIGHALQHGHVIDNSRVMHFAISSGSDKRTLDNQSAIAGARWVLDRSNIRNLCGRTAHQSIASHQCRFNAQTGFAPTAHFSADKTTGCAPLTVNFTDNSTGNPTLWQWDMDGNGTIDYTTRNVSHTYTIPGTYTVRLTVSNAFGSNQSVRVGYISVSANNINLTLSPNNPTVCSGTPITLTAFGADQYSWVNSAGMIVGFGSTYSFIPTQTTTFTVNGTRNGCTTSRSVTVSVFQQIQLNTVLTHPTNNQSNGSITVNPSNGLFPYSYQINNGFFQTGNVFTNLNAGTYQINVRDARGCTQSTVAVLTNSNTGGGGGGNTGTCSPPVTALGTITNTTAQITWLPVGGATQYIIMYRAIGGGWLQTTSFFTSVNLFGLTANTHYEVYVRAICSGGMQSLYSNALSFRTSTNENPPDDQNNGGGNTVSCNTPTNINVQAGQNFISLTWQPVTGAVNYRASWRLQGSQNWLSATIFTPNLSIASLLPNSNYEVQLIANCSGSSSTPSNILQVKTLSGRDAGPSFSKDYDVSIFPNPTTGLLHIQGTEPNTELIITDLAGKILTQQRLTETNSLLELNHYPKGVYLLHLRTETDSKQAIHKVVLY